MKHFANFKPMFLVMLVLTLLLAGCSSSNNGGSSQGGATSQPPSAVSDTESSGESRTLTVYHRPFFNELEEKQWQLIAQTFEEQNEGVTVKFEIGDVAVETGKLTTMLNSGVDQPDVLLIFAGPARVEVLSNAGLIQPLNDMYERNNWEDELIPFTYNMATLKEQIYELPHAIDFIGMSYNKDVFEAAGVEFPTTKEDFFPAMEKILEAGYTPFSLGVRGGYSASQLFGQIMESVAGTEKMENLFFGDGKWTDPEIIESAEMLKEWVDRGIISKEAVSLTTDDLKALFSQKKAAFKTSFNYDISSFMADNIIDTIGIGLLPAFKDGLNVKPTGGIGYTWVVPSEAKNVDLAERWLNFILAEYAGILFQDPSASFIPATKKAFDLEPASEMLGEMIEAIKGGNSYNPTVFIGNNAKEAILQNLQGLIGGLITPQEAMENTEEARLKDVAEGFKLKD